jgi:hypothetical protein
MSAARINPPSSPTMPISIFHLLTDLSFNLSLPLSLSPDNNNTTINNNNTVNNKSNNNSSSNEHESRSSRDNSTEKDRNRHDKEARTASTSGELFRSKNGSSESPQRRSSRDGQSSTEKSWSYPPGLDNIMASGAFWQNYSGEATATV